MVLDLVMDLDLVLDSSTTSGTDTGSGTTGGDPSGAYSESGSAKLNYEKYGSELERARVRIELQGGGGIGALATPVVGLDGAILHVRVVHGGFGYKFPPQVRIIDDNKRGAGAKARSILGDRALVETRTEAFDDAEYV